MELPIDAAGEYALSQPTRARLFALLSDLERPAGTAELAERLGLHPNGVRVHLERMRRAGLVVRARTPQARGRPPDAWTLTPQVRPADDTASAYRDLSRWLARALASGGGVRALEAAGREAGREVAPRDCADAVEGMQRTLTALGFAPELEREGERRLTFCLRNCPYREAVQENQQAVCALHKGITRGLLDVLDPEARVASFLPADPVRAGCVIELSGVGGESASGGPRAI